MKIRFLLLIGVVAAIFCTCDPDGDSRVVGDVFTDNRAVLGYVDSFSLTLSTVRLDSFITSGNTDIVMGYCKDEKVGNVSAETYIPIVYSSKTNIPDDAEYDSIIICFKPKGGWIGDTLKPKEVKIYEVLEEIRPRYYADQQQMFNHIKLERSETELATVTIDPFPKRGLVSWAHISDSLGRKWFEMVRDGDDAMDKTDYFLEYFKGICIVPQTTDCTWGLDFVTTSTVAPASRVVDDVTQFEIRLCYHKSGDDELGSYMTFVPKANSNQYVYFDNDRSGTPFDTLQIDGGRIYSAQSEHVSYIQTGSGLALRIDFPTLASLNSASEYMSVVDARLLIKPKEFSFDEANPLPSRLYLILTDESNDLQSNLVDLQGNIVSSEVKYTQKGAEEPYYLFSVIGFVRKFINVKTDNSLNPMALIVMPSDNENSSLFKRLVVDDNTQRAEDVQLQIYYVTY